MNKKRKTIIARIMTVVVAAVMAAGLMPDPLTDMPSAGSTMQAATSRSVMAIDTSDSGEPVPNQYIVKTKDGKFELVETDKGIETLKNDENVVAVEPNRIVTAYGQPSVNNIVNQDVEAMQYGDEMVRAPEAWEMLPDETATVRVAVIDTGIDATHPDLAGKVIKGTTVMDTNSSGNKYADDGNDDHGHGTHVAGIIAATWDNNIGINGVTGKVNIELMPVKVLDDSGRGTTYDIIQGIIYAADNGASILNLSLGSGASSSMEAEAVKYAQNKGCLVIAAAGNDSVDVATNWPASYDGVISVGSVDAQGERSYFSNYGATLDVAAPGSDIISTIPKKVALKESAYGNTVYGNDVDGYYVSWSGTSMATPHVSGVAAIYKAVNPGVTGADIGDLLIKTCQDTGEIGKDIETGSGIVDAAAILGAEVVKTPLKIKAPKAGSELFEEVVLSAQINPTMDIRKLVFYLDEEDEASVIAEIACDENNSFYETVWDTKQNKDGEHKVLAVVYDSKGNKVGDTQSVNVDILNNITNGFTLQVLAPNGEKAENASYKIYGKTESGSYKALKTGTTSQLGYSRVKGVSTDYEEYQIVISGRFTTENGAGGVYCYRNKLMNADLGSKVTITGENVQPADVQIRDADKEDMKSYYLKLDIPDGTGYLPAVSAMSVNSDTELYLAEGTYRAQVFKASDDKGRSYYLENEWEITSMNHACTVGTESASRITAEYAGGVEGILKLEGRTEKIPFMSGYISGNEIYVSSGEYTAYADMTSGADGRAWQLSMEKSEAVVVDGSEITVRFTPEIKITGFELTGLKSGEDGPYIYVGDSLSSKNIFGDLNGDRIIQATQTYPEFSIYKITDEGRELIYSKTDRGNSSSSYWNSSNMYNGSIPPGAGNYVAQLSYDAGPFGGKTVKEVEFSMRTKSGGEEMTSTVTMDGKYKMSYASMEIYSWNEDTDSWDKANTKKFAQAGEDGVIRNIGTDYIQLGESGINVAVIEFNGRKEGYQLPGEYIGFTVVPFTTLDELEVIDIASDELNAVPVGITDQYGNRKSGNIYFPAVSDGGKLAAEKTVCDVELGIGTAMTAKVYIPEGEYDYAYSRFNDSEANYFLTHVAFNTSDSEKIILDGQDTKTLDLVIDENYRNSKVFIKMKSADRSVSFSTSVGNTLKVTPGEYGIGMEALSQDKSYKYRVDKDSALNMNEDSVWAVGFSFRPEIVLNQKTVAADQMLMADMFFRDGKGNCLTEFSRINDGVYVPVYPEVVIGAANVGEQWFSLGKENGLRSFSVDPGYYYGEGPHFVSVRYDIGNGKQQTSGYPFVVGLDYIPRLEAADKEGFVVEKISDSEIHLKADADTSGYQPVTIEFNTSSRQREVTFEQYREDKVINRVTVNTIMVSKESNNLTAYFNFMPGDVIKVKAK